MNALPFFANTPPISRAWVIAMTVLAALTTNDIVPLEKLVLIPKKLSTEPWRLVSLFFYFGPLSLWLLQHALLIVRTTGPLEMAYHLGLSSVPSRTVAKLTAQLRQHLAAAMAANKMADFAYFMVLVAASILALVMASIYVNMFSGNLVFPGPILDKVLLYIWCRNCPEEQLVLVGVALRAKYFPFIMNLLQFFMQKEYHTFVAIVRSQGLRDAVLWLVRSPYAVETLIVFVVAHSWWFVRFFCIEDVYNEAKSELRELWRAAYAQYSAASGPAWLEAARWLTLPPWYHVTISRLLREQGPAAANELLRLARALSVALEEEKSRPVYKGAANAEPENAGESALSDLAAVVANGATDADSAAGGAGGEAQPREASGSDEHGA